MPQDAHHSTDDASLLAGRRVGVLGGGQLGLMLAQAAAKVGVVVRCYDPDPSACAWLACECVRGAWDDLASIERFARASDVVTLEFENVPASTLEHAGRFARVAPGAPALRVAQDRAQEKEFFERAGLRVHPWAPVASLAELREAATKIGFPAVLKTRHGGYDGKGQAVVRDASGLEHAWRAIGERPAILERMVAFTRELSVIAVRGTDGSFSHYPLTQNTHEAGILRTSIAPAPGVENRTQCEAVSHVRTLTEQLSYVGVLAVEFFEEDGLLLANEMAPRVHNSGHWTIEGATTSQFENQLRAILGVPLGSCDAVGASAMVNFIGSLPDADAVARLGATLHDYGKQSRPGRKLGHATIVAQGCSSVDLAMLDGLVRAAIAPPE